MEPFFVFQVFCEVGCGVGFFSWLIVAGYFRWCEAEHIGGTNLCLVCTRIHGIMHSVSIQSNMCIDLRFIMGYDAVGEWTKAFISAVNPANNDSYGFGKRFIILLLSEEFCQHSGEVFEDSFQTLRV